MFAGSKGNCTTPSPSLKKEGSLKAQLKSPPPFLRRGSGGGEVSSSLARYRAESARCSKVSVVSVSFRTADRCFEQRPLRRIESVVLLMRGNLRHRGGRQDRVRAQARRSGTTTTRMIKRAATAATIQKTIMAASLSFHRVNYDMMIFFFRAWSCASSGQRLRCLPFNLHPQNRCRRHFDTGQTKTLPFGLLTGYREATQQR